MKKVVTKTSSNARQQSFALEPTSPPPVADGACNVVSVGKRRDGGTKYWCLQHRADATAKYGRPAAKCRYADVPEVLDSETLILDLSKYAGGVACWGAVSPVYDTTTLPLDRGIHVHARKTTDGPKLLDGTYRRVLLADGGTSHSIEELDAIYYMVSSVFGYEMREVVCTLCGYSHLDKDWFSVHGHRRHLCSGCGRQFRDAVIGIGNPIVGVRNQLGLRGHTLKPSRKKLNIRQEDYTGGIQIWGSNPALIWTSSAAEEEGIHVHVFAKNGDEKPYPDDTYSEVTVDGVKLDAEMVRTLMAQMSLPHVSGRIVSKHCPRCGEIQFARGERAFAPAVENECSSCGTSFASEGRLRKTISNPLVDILSGLAGQAPRPPQTHDMGLLPETL
jgi:transposase-like protein